MLDFNQKIIYNMLEKSDEGKKDYNPLKESLKKVKASKGSIIPNDSRACWSIFRSTRESALMN